MLKSRFCFSIFLFLSLFSTNCFAKVTVLGEEASSEPKKMSQIIGHEEVSFTAPSSRVTEKSDSSGRGWLINESPEFTYGVVIKPYENKDSIPNKDDLNEFYKYSLDKYKNDPDMKLVDSNMRVEGDQIILNFDLEQKEKLYKARIIFTPFARHSLFSMTPLSKGQKGLLFLNSYVIRQVGK